jgi:hypothetical protein
VSPGKQFPQTIQTSPEGRQGSASTKVQASCLCASTAETKSSHFRCRNRRGSFAEPWHMRQRTFFSPSQFRQREPGGFLPPATPGTPPRDRTSPGREVLGRSGPALRDCPPNDDPAAPSPPLHPDQLSTGSGTVSRTAASNPRPEIRTAEPNAQSPGSPGRLPPTYYYILPARATDLLSFKDSVAACC